MPMSRYEIRNEYSLADPELYRAADKDDPEALLEGVAMAALVGVLRQLGDLAQFAAEIFHDLHEQVMVTAARGHSLLIRVEQLESQVPYIEKAFLSQTDHSTFFYTAGIEWHPSPRMGQNLVAQGDLPRFIMDSYEECRGPPRLFLLDKFDVAGAGACLKRYSDPSSLKVEISEMTSANFQREKKIRRAKKKVPRWRNGATPEVLPTSHAKLHQLFLEECVENGVSNHVRRVKLKRRLNGFPFDTKAGKSYMEKLLKTPSPEHEMFDEVGVTSSLLMLPTDDDNASIPEVLEVSPTSPDRESVQRKICSPSPSREEVMLNPSMDEPNEVSRDDRIFEGANSYPSLLTDEYLSSLDKVTGENDIATDGETKTENRVTVYESDDIASEIDNYVDASSSMESEMDTDSELRVDSDVTSSVIKTQSLISDVNEDDLRTLSADAQSPEKSTMSDERNNSSKKEIAWFSSSRSPSTSAENPHSEIMLPEGSPSADTHGIDLVDGSSYQTTADNFAGDPSHVVLEYTCTRTDALTNKSDSGESTMSDERNNSSQKEIAWFSSSRSQSTSAENPHSETMLPEGSPSADTPEIDLVDGLSYQTTADNFAGDPSHVVAEYTCTRTDALTNKSDSGESTMSDERNNSSQKEIAWFSSSRSQSTSAENPHSETMLPEGSSSADTPEIDLVDGLSYQTTADNFAGDPSHVVAEYTCNRTNSLTNNNSDSEQLTSSLCSTYSVPIISYFDSEEVTRIDRKMVPELDNMLSASEDEEKEINLVKSAPCATSFFHSAPQSGDNSPRSSAEEHAVDEPKDLLHEDDFDHNDLNLAQSTWDTLLPNMNYNLEIIPTENPIPGKLDGGVPKLPECFLPDCTDIAQNGDNITSTVSQEEKISDELDNEESSASADFLNRFSDIMQASHGKEPIETSIADACNVEAEEHYCESPIDDQINLGNVILLHAENSLDWPGAVIDAHEIDVSTLEETTLNETSARGTPESSEVLGSQDQGVTYDIPPKDPAALESSCGTPYNSEEPADTLDNLVGSRIAPPMNTIGVEVTKNLGSADVELGKESDCETEQSKTAHTDSAGPSVSDNASRNSFILPVGHDKLVEEHTPCANDSDLDELEDDNNYLSGRHRDKLVEEHTSCCEDSDLDELEDDKICLSRSHKESNLGDDVGNREVTASDLGRVFCGSVNNDHLKAEVSDSVCNSYLGLDVRHSSDFGNATMIQSPLEESGLQETIKQSAVRSHDPDAPPMPINSNIEETIFQGKLELPPNQLHEVLLHSGDISSELSPRLPSNTLQIMDHNDEEGDNKSTSIMSPFKSSSPPSLPEIPGLGNNEINVSAYPKDPSGSIFPPYNISSDANQINLGELPPFPPLPPVQWMMGKLEHDSPITEGEIMQHELFPRVLSLPIASANAVSFSMEEMNHSLVHVAPETAQKEDKVGHSLFNLEAADMYATANLQFESIDEPQKPTSSTSAVSSSIEEMKHSLAQIAPESASKEEKFEHTLSNLEANDMYDEPMDLQLERAYETRKPIASTDAVSVTLEEANHSLIQINLDAPAKNETVEHNKSCSLEVYAMNEAADFLPEVEKDQQQPSTSNEDVSSSLEEANYSMIHIDSKTISKQEKVQHYSSSLEANPIDDTINLPQKIENEPRKLILPFPGSEFTSPADEDNWNRKVKIPRPRNPLIKDVAALDKSKLKKVTERVLPQIQKVDERDSLLEQIRTKSFNLKPAMTSRPSIRDPKTNLKLAAILEKANAIRQAFADSDEDDEDGWSDS